MINSISKGAINLKSIRLELKYFKNIGIKRLSPVNVIIKLIETLSVMIQVVYFRFRQKRVFLMTPLHHHFELLGMSEVSVVLLFSMVQGIFSIIQLQ